MIDRDNESLAQAAARLLAGLKHRQEVVHGHRKPEAEHEPRGRDTFAESLLKTMRPKEPPL